MPRRLRAPTAARAAALAVLALAFAPSSAHANGFAFADWNLFCGGVFQQQQDTQRGFAQVPRQVYSGSVAPYTGTLVAAGLSFAGEDSAWNPLYGVEGQITTQQVGTTPSCSVSAGGITVMPFDVSSSNSAISMASIELRFDVDGYFEGNPRSNDILQLGFVSNLASAVDDLFNPGVQFIGDLTCEPGTGCSGNGLTSNLTFTQVAARWNVTGSVTGSFTVPLGRINMRNTVFGSAFLAPDSGQNPIIDIGFFFANTITYSLTPLDPSVSVTMASVPEPGAALLVAPLAVYLGWRSARGRRRAT